MKLSKKSALKFAGLQVGIIVAVLITQAVMVFFSQNKILVIVPKNDEKSFYGLYASAKTDYLTCQTQVEELRKARDEANSDILGDDNE